MTVRHIELNRAEAAVTSGRLWVAGPRQQDATTLTHGGVAAAAPVPQPWAAGAGWAGAPPADRW